MGNVSMQHPHAHVMWAGEQRLILLTIAPQIAPNVSHTRWEFHETQPPVTARKHAGTCPSGVSWGSLPTGVTSAHATTECSSKGLCNRATGQCRCFAGYNGDACQRSACPNSCSGHGRCMAMRDMALAGNAMPIGPATSYDGFSVSCTKVGVAT